MRRLAFFLAHHHPDEYDRCYRLGPLRLCARCTGLYPAMIVMLVLQARGVIAAPRAEWVLLYALPLPAVVSWTRRRLLGVTGSNPVTTLSGALLGVALGRGLFVYFADPRAPVFWAQIAGLTVAVIAVEIMRRVRRR